MFEKVQIEKGSPNPLGINCQNDKVNFAIFSSHATSVTLVVFENRSTPGKEFPLNRTGNIWHIELQGLQEGVSYAVRCKGPYDERQGLLFKDDKLLIDPYARKVVDGRALIEKQKPFDWRGVQPPNIPEDNLVIYEMHVRGFTKHPSSKVTHPGTFLGIIEKIPYLKQLGVNVVELLPIFYFNEKIHSPTHKALKNYWGYNPLHFFALMPLFGVSDPVLEFKTLVRELHSNGIKIVLDVVFSHTGEENDKNYYVNFRGLDNPVYYILGADGSYQDFTGCGNTLNSNQPVTQHFILDCLRFWMEEMHVDGFRFDLASTFTRDTTGKPICDSPILKALNNDPVISKAILIAEPWDEGLYEVDAFPKWGPWKVWNGYYRDGVRRFIKGDENLASTFGNILCGSHNEYASPLSSINFITAHDGFTLRDLVTYNQKHNEENGESNRDGNDHNDSWNCGAEGPVNDQKIKDLRERQMRNFFLALFLSQGIPMLLMSDEYGRTRSGNNNPYAQDNELNWFLWDELEKNKKIFSFVSSLIDFRKQHPHFHYNHPLTDKEIEWHGTEPLKPDWSSHSRFVAFTLKGDHPIYLAFNASSQAVKITLPPNVKWQEVVNTNQDFSQHNLQEPSKGKILASTLDLGPYSALLAKGS